MQLNEDFLHYIWQYRLLTSIDLCCTGGQELKIIHPGMLNKNAGPDFSAAKLRIGGQLWAGDVELHVKASDWFLHQHQHDAVYDAVILHAVYEDDQPVYRTDGTLIPVLVLKGLVPEILLSKYLDLIGSRNFFPCEKQLYTVNPQTLYVLFDACLLQRMEQKSALLKLKMRQNKHHWKEGFYELLMRNFGFGINAVPFELLANALPAKILGRHRDQPLQVEALLFGQAGFLERDYEDEYPQMLKAEYRFLRQKYQLKPLERSLWRFLRMHPQNFPPLRIAQAAGIVLNQANSWDILLKEKDLRILRSIFSSINVHPYWKNHADFDKPCKPVSVKLGKRSVDSLIINTVCILRYYYGRYFNRLDLMKQAADLMDCIPAECNAITRRYIDAGIRLRHAGDSQAILQLYANYCSLKKCLNCIAGIEIIGE